VRAQGARDLRGEQAEPLDQGPQRGDQGEHAPAPRVGFQLAGAPRWRVAQPLEQLGRRLAPAVVVAREPLREPLLAQAAGSTGDG
jgi:hypothetical protein